MSMILRELQEKRNRAITAGRSIVDVAEKEGRGLSDDEKRQHNDHLKEAVECREQIERVQAQEAEEKRELGLLISEEEGQRKNLTPEAEQRSKAFRNLLMHGPAGMSHEEIRALTAGSDTQGGFLGAPQEFVKQLIVKLKDISFIRGLATGFSTSSNEGIGAPSLDTDLDDAEWTTEIKKISEDDMLRFGKRELKPHPYKKRILISDKQLRSEAMDTEAVVMDHANYKFDITEEKAFILGDGNQKPLGMFVASKDGINIDRDVTGAGMDAANTTTTIGADGLIAAKYGLKAQYQGKAKWLFHRDSIKQIATLKTGDGYYLFDLSAKSDVPDLLLGRPMMMSEYVPNTFTAGKYVGMFGDFSWYWICDSLALRIKRLNELYAENSLVGFIFEKETDGAPVLAEAFSRIQLAP